MKLRALAAALGLACGPAVAQDGAALDRLTTREDLRGFEPVGRVDVADGGFCTGTLIAADLVLTAAHCVLGDDGTPVPAETITFRAGLSDGVALVEASVLRTVVDSGYRPVTPAPPEMIRLDVALLQLVTPIPSSEIAPFTVSSPGAGSEVSVVSYADGREDALSWQPVCNVLARQEGLIGLDCDVSYGSSGAPVLDRSGYRATVVSLISVGATMEGRRIAVGMELPGLVARLKTALRNGDHTSEAVRDDASTGVGKRVAAGSVLGTPKGDTGARFVKP
jgi:protease YdgD